MRLDRRDNTRGKYGIINHRKLDEIAGHSIEIGNIEEVLNAIAVLQRHHVYDPCDTVETEVFVLKLKDKYAAAALHAYAHRAIEDDVEYAADIEKLARRAGSNHPNCKKPD